MVREILVGDRNLVVVAHPDDETLWAAGLPLRFADREWTVIACSIPRIDPVRADRFHAACRTLGVASRVLPEIETEPGQKLNGLEALDLSPFDCIVTHNSQGEYGHSHHRHVHKFVKSRINGQKLITFGYRESGQGEISFELTDEELYMKLRALRCYDHISPTDGKPKWEALIDVYYVGKGISAAVETYDCE